MYENHPSQNFYFSKEMITMNISQQECDGYYSWYYYKVCIYFCPDCSKLAKNPKNDNHVTIFRHDVNVNFFDVVLFLLSSLVTGPSFISISSLVLELWQFSFIRDWPEIRKSEILPSEFCPISRDWDKIWLPNLARML